MHRYSYISDAKVKSTSDKAFDSSGLLQRKFSSSYKSTVPPYSETGRLPRLRGGGLPSNSTGITPKLGVSALLVKILKLSREVEIFRCR